MNGRGERASAKAQALSGGPRPPEWNSLRSLREIEAVEAQQPELRSVMGALGWDPPQKGAQVQVLTALPTSSLPPNSCEVRLGLKFLTRSYTFFPSLLSKPTSSTTRTPSARSLPTPWSSMARFAYAGPPGSPMALLRLTTTCTRWESSSTAAMPCWTSPGASTAPRPAMTVPSSCPLPRPGCQGHCMSC